MKTLSRIALMVALVAGVTLLAAPAAEACCRPCEGFCDGSVSRDTPCCTGIPEPGNACGLTTCGKYLSGGYEVDEVASSAAATAALPSGPQSTEEACPVEPLFAEPAGELAAD